MNIQLDSNFSLKFKNILVIGNTITFFILHKEGRGLERIGEILETKQPDLYKQFNKKKKRKRKRKRKRKKRREAQSEHLSFEFIDKLMRERTCIDEGKCRGR